MWGSVYIFKLTDYCSVAQKGNDKISLPIDVSAEFASPSSAGFVQNRNNLI